MEVAEFIEDEAGIGVGRETGLKRFEVVEFDRRRRREERGGGNAGRDKGFADGGVGAPYGVDRVR